MIVTHARNRQAERSVLPTRVGAIVAGILCLTGASAHAQLWVPKSRSATTYAACGDASSGPHAQHDVASFDEIHDHMSFSDTGFRQPPALQCPPSSAFSDHNTTLSPTGIEINLAGGGERGSIPPGGNNGATGSSQQFDTWNFTLTAPTCFTMEASLQQFSTEGATETIGYQLFSANFGITQSNGQPTNFLLAFISANGSISNSYSGTLAPGDYNLSIHGQSSRNAFPSSGTYSCSVKLVLDAQPSIHSQPAPVTDCGAGSPSFSVSASGPGTLTYQWQVADSQAAGGWANLANGDNTLSDSSAFAAAGAKSPNLSITHHSGSGVIQLPSHSDLRCIITGPCGSLTSNSATLTLCAADLDCDQTVDLTDFFQFLNCFDQTQPCADLTGEGDIDLNDFFAFFNAFDQTC